MQGTLLARDLAHHISGIPPSALPSGFLQAAGLHGSASDILERHSMASLATRYSALLRVHLKHAEAKIKRAELAAASKKKRLEVTGQSVKVFYLTRPVLVVYNNLCKNHG